ncbi:MAG: LysM peptidoglycan-binding domain-containing protein [Anaerolineales bacterium]|nr:LysM peptidoglycan-binding domain-containing protein [Anaerolineales bacterium]
MKNKRLFVLALMVILVLVLGACTRSASTPVAETDFNLPQDGTANVGEELIIQSTAAAIDESDTQAGEAEDQNPPAEEQAQPEDQSEPDVQEPATQPETQEPEPQAPAVQPSYEVPDTYTLQAGEYPYCIARRFNINAGTLLSVNGLGPSSMVYPGHVLTIPKDAGPFVGERALRPHGAYTVQPGDTVYSIACLYGDVDPRAIEAANNLTGVYSLNVGSELIIP